MNNIRILFLAICAIACLLPTYGQKDTITAEGIFPKYNHLVYRPKDLSKHTIEIVEDGEIKESSTDPNGTDKRRIRQSDKSYRANI